MPIPDQRDPATTRSRLAEWLGTKLPGATDVTVGDIGGPAATGFSNETILFDAHWTEDGEARQRHLVARVKPSAYTLFLEPEFEMQYRVMKALHTHTDVPMPAVHWYEDDEAWLGAPFWVMDKVEGDVPGDDPPYTMKGFLTEATPDQQQRLYWSGLEAMAAVHRTDWEALGLGSLDRPDRGRVGAEQQLRYYEEYLAWAAEGRPQPVTEAAFDWVRANLPPAPQAPGLCWGDSRIGNQLFRDFRCVGVLDWEMVALGDPVQDLAWWVFLDRHMAEGIGVPRLAGFPSYEATVARWEQLTGRSVDPDVLHFYEVFAGMRFAVIMIRLARLLHLYELLPPDSDMETDNIVTQLLAKQLGL